MKNKFQEYMIREETYRNTHCEILIFKDVGDTKHRILIYDTEEKLIWAELYFEQSPWKPMEQILQLFVPELLNDLKDKI